MGYFDLSNEAGGLAAESGPKPMPLWEQVLMYGTTAVGVIVSKGIAQARAGELITFDLSWPFVAVALAVALLLFPAVWSLIGARADAPIVARLGLALQQGAFWTIVIQVVQNGVSAAE